MLFRPFLLLLGTLWKNSGLLIFLSLISLCATVIPTCRPTPRLPSDMMHSILLSAECIFCSYTKWFNNLKEKPLHAILSSFTVGGALGIDTFYDFQAVWHWDKNNISNSVHPPKTCILLIFSKIHSEQYLLFKVHLTINFSSY